MRLIGTWLNSDSNDPGFQLMTDNEICDHVLSEQVPGQEDEPEPKEGESNVCLSPTPRQLICLRRALHGLNASLK